MGHRLAPRMEAASTRSGIQARAGALRVPPAGTAAGSQGRPASSYPRTRLRASRGTVGCGARCFQTTAGRPLRSRAEQLSSTNHTTDTSDMSRYEQHWNPLTTDLRVTLKAKCDTAVTIEKFEECPPNDKTPAERRKPGVVGPRPAGGELSPLSGYRAVDCTGNSKMRSHPCVRQRERLILLLQRCVWFLVHRCWRTYN